MSRIILASFALSFTITGCDSKTCDTAGVCDTGPAGGDGGGGDGGGPTAIAITDITWGCSGSDYSFSVTADGAPNGIDIWMGQDAASPWGPEVHQLDATGAADDGSWTSFDHILPTVYPDFGNQVDNQNTGFICGKPESMEYTLGFIFEIFSGDSSEECRWVAGGGAVAVAGITGFDLSGCSEW